MNVHLCCQLGVSSEIGYSYPANFLGPIIFALRLSLSISPRLNKGIVFLLISNSCGWSVSGVNFCFIRQSHEFLADAVHEPTIAHPGEIKSAYSTIKQGVSGEHDSMTCQRDASGCVSGSVKNNEPEVADFDSVTVS